MTPITLVSNLEILVTLPRTLKAPSEKFILLVGPTRNRARVRRIQRPQCKVLGYRGGQNVYR